MQSAAGREQAILARIQTQGDTFYRGHEGGFAAEAAVDGRAPDRRAGWRALCRDHHLPGAALRSCQRKVRHTPNLATLQRTADALRKAGFPESKSTPPARPRWSLLQALAEAGATQVEPGNGLHGTTPLHAVEDLPERPGRSLSDRSQPPARGSRLLLWRRALYRPGVPRL